MKIPKKSADDVSTSLREQDLNDSVDLLCLG